MTDDVFLKGLKTQKEGLHFEKIDVKQLLLVGPHPGQVLIEEVSTPPRATDDSPETLPPLSLDRDPEGGEEAPRDTTPGAPRDSSLFPCPPEGREREEEEVPGCETPEGVSARENRTGSIISTDEGMANIFNEYFASVYTEEDTSEIPIVPIVYRGNNPLRKIEITVDKVKMKLKKLNSNKSAGPDGFYPRVIKETKEETAPRFCNIFRTSLEQRKAVRDWKLQNISPLFKKGSKDDPGNYRPISLTSVPGKMLESIIADDMMSHLEHNKLILDSQHGFRSGRSCLTNLVDFFHDMFSIYDKSRAVDILYLDFRKAFDKVPHKRLSVFWK